MSKNQTPDFIQPPNTLKEKVGNGLNMIDAGAIDRAEQALAEIKENIRDWLNDDLEKLQCALDAYVSDPSMPDAHQNLYTCAHDLKGLGATYEFPLVSRIAASFCELMKTFGKGNPIPAPVVRAHSDAISLIVRENIQTSDNQVGLTLAKELESKVSEVCRSGT